MTDREAFEAAYRRLYPITCENTPDKFEWLVDHYSDSTVHVAWRLWQARAALVAQPANTDSVPGSPASKVTRPDERTCTCHPDDNPPVPCARKYAYSECIASRQDAPGSSIVLGAEGEQ